MSSFHNEIIPDESRAAQGTRAAAIVRGGERFDLWFRSEESLPLDAGFADADVLATLQYWMERGGTVHVRGTVSRRLLSNLDEWQTVWLHWLPGTYSRVEFTADRITEAPVTTATAIAAFSGGVDSMCTALRHSRSLVRSRSFPLGALLLVHGFDIPLASETDFGLARVRAESAARLFGVELRSVATNLRDLEQDWERCCGLAIAAALQLFADEFGTGLIGSTAPYGWNTPAWGSTPLTDHLLSSDRLQICHDGAELTRTEKLRTIGRDARLVELLRVCWEGERRDRNCGRCEKCIRTSWCMHIAGVPQSCFDAPVTVLAREVRVSEVLAKAWATMLTEAKEAGDDEAIVYIRAVLRTQRVRAGARRVKRLRRFLPRARP